MPHTCGMNNGDNGDNMNNGDNGFRTTAGSKAVAALRRAPVAVVVFLSGVLMAVVVIAVEAIPDGQIRPGHLVGGAFAGLCVAGTTLWQIRRHRTGGRNTSGG